MRGKEMRPPHLTWTDCDPTVAWCPRGHVQVFNLTPNSSTALEFNLENCEGKQARPDVPSAPAPDLRKNRMSP